MTVPEATLIPYQAESLRGERLLVLAPHPDDEVIGCGGLIAQHTREKREVRVIIVTDGAAAEVPSESVDAYRARREAESIAGLGIVGAPAPHFLQLPDRQLSGWDTVLSKELRRILLEARPDLIAVPSPIEIHPDHVALSRAFFDLIQRDDAIAETIPLARVAFYEVSQPFRPNLLVDITDVAEQKYQAIAAHESQRRLRDYESFARGLNQYRSMTLGPSSRFAEAYRVVELRKLRLQPWSALVAEAGGTQTVGITREAVPVTVIVRTRNRPAWLKEALDSIVATGYPAAIVVVNDGGTSVRWLAESYERLELIESEVSSGRSEAMNRGVAAAATSYLSFLDDDDLFYPEHLSTLSAAAQNGDFAAYYSDAVSAFYEMDEDGSWRQRDRIRVFAHDFDPLLLQFDNYIPLTTLLVRREDFLSAGGFDPQFDLFEDWDFLLRLAKKGSFCRIPKVTCEIRHFAGNPSAVLASPEGSERFRAAKLAVWTKHGIAGTKQELLGALEKLKARGQRSEVAAFEAAGRAHHLETDVTRLERDKQLLIEQLSQLHQTHAALTTQDVTLRAEVELREREIASLTRQSESRGHELRAIREHAGHLDGLLQQIYRSRTWKLHEMVERIKGTRRE